MAIMNIQEYFPFDRYRKYQKKVIEKIINAYLDENKRVVILEAPTGSGKSVIAVTVARYFGRGNFVTPYKNLQDQYLSSFVNLDMVTLKGMSNYYCGEKGRLDILSKNREKQLESLHENGLLTSRDTFPDLLTADYGACKFQRSKRSSCPYKEDQGGCYYYHKNIAAQKNFVVYNSFIYMLLGLGRGELLDTNLLVIDECHGIENWLTQFISLRYSKRTLGLALRDFPTTEDHVLPFLHNVIEFFENILESIKEGTVTEADINLLKHVFRTTKIPDLYEIIEKLSDRITNTQFVLDNTHNFVPILEKDYKIGDVVACELKPVKVGSFKEKLFFKAPKILLMSATILDHVTFCKNIGLAEHEVKFITIPSTFPVKNRPVYCTKDLGSLNKENIDSKLERAQKIISYIAAKNKTRGIIHTHTHKIADYIFINAKAGLKKRLTCTVKNNSREEMITHHILTKGSILLSPSLTEGLDLYENLGRWGIIVKVPYPNLGDPIIKARSNIDFKWYIWQTCLTIVQACGRTTRSEKDWSTVYILDGEFERLFRSYPEMFPKWFRDAVYFEKTVKNVLG